MRKEAVRAIAKSLGATNAEELLEALGRESMMNDYPPSFCLACGAQGSTNVEPDVYDDPCEACEASRLAGLETVLLAISMADQAEIDACLKPEEGVLRRKIREQETS